MSRLNIRQGSRGVTASFARIWPPLIEQLESIEARLPESRKRALRYLQTADPHESNEALILRALREQVFGSEEDGTLRERLISRQNSDGGWSNRFDRSESDAYATGQTLYALSLLDVPKDHPAVIKARDLLVRIQRDDGSWLVAAEQMRMGGSRESLTEIFSYWGTAWAAIGLLRTLPASSP